MPPDYSNTVIYRLYCIDPDIDPDYIGHSADFHKREIRHKSDCNNNKNSSEKRFHHKVYKFIRENGGFDNWQFEILVYADLKDKYEAKKLEKHYIKIFKPTLNDADVAVTPEERAEYTKKWQRIKYKENREDPEFMKKQAEKTKKQREANPEKTAATQAASRAKAKEKITCVCGVIHSWKYKSDHLKTEKHKKFVKNNPQEV